MAGGTKNVKQGNPLFQRVEPRDETLPDHAPMTAVQCIHLQFEKSSSLISSRATKMDEFDVEN